MIAPMLPCLSSSTRSTRHATPSRRPSETASRHPPHARRSARAGLPQEHCQPVRDCAVPNVQVRTPRASASTPTASRAGQARPRAWQYWPAIPARDRSSSAIAPTRSGGLGIRSLRSSVGVRASRVSARRTGPVVSGIARHASVLRPRRRSAGWRPAARSSQ